MTPGFALPRRTLLAVGCIPLLASSQAPGRRRLAFLTVETAASNVDTLAAFEDSMRRLGWEANRHYVLETYFGDGDYKRMRDMAQKMAAEPPEILLTPHNSATSAAKRWMPPATAIIMVSSLDPVSAGFVGSLARPGGNITGLTWAPPETIGKQVEIIKQLVPAARRLVVLTQSSRESMAQVDHARPAAQQLRLEVVPVIADTMETLAQRLPVEETAARGITVAVVPAMAAYYAFRMELHQLLQARGMPAVYAQRGHVVAGGLASYGPNLAGNFRQAARFADRVLRGAKPADLPTEQPTTYDLVLNRGAVRTQRLTLPHSLLLSATEVID